MVIINREHGVYPGLYAFDRLLIGNAANADIDSSNVCPGSFVQQARRKRFLPELVSPVWLPCVKGAVSGAD